MADFFEDGEVRRDFEGWEGEVILYSFAQFGFEGRFGMNIHD